MTAYEKKYFKSADFPDTGSDTGPGKFQHIPHKTDERPLKEVSRFFQRGRLILPGKVFTKNYFLPDKRQRFGVQTLVLTGGLLISQFIWNDYRFVMVIILSVMSYLLTTWSLKEDVKGVEWFLLFILPVFFTASVSLFYFLLPGRMIVRLFITTLFVVGSYAVLLIENIYNVAGERSIQLLRAAQSIGLLISLSVVFFISNIIISLRLSFWQNFIIILPFIFALSLQSLWSVRLETKLNGQIILYSFMVAFCLGQLILTLSFWPVDTATASLLIVSSYYGLVGVIQQYFAEKLFRNSIREYIYAFILTLIVTVLATRWS